MRKELREKLYIVFGFVFLSEGYTGFPPYKNECCSWSSSLDRVCGSEIK